MSGTNKSQSNKRRRYFIDKKVQGALIRQLLTHWMIANFVVFSYLLVLQMFSTGMQGTFSEHVTAIWERYAPLIVVAVTFFPVFLYDAVRLSHRFAGPMVNLKRYLKSLANGEAVSPLKFRDKDFWQELTGDVNAIADKMGLIQQQKDQSPAAS